MRIQLSDHFTYPRLLRFVLPSVLMILCTSIYSIVDGFFIANFVGKTPFAAINLVMPVLMGVATIGFMIGTGGSAIVSKTLGEGKTTLANQYFTLLVCFAFLLGVTISALVGRKSMVKRLSPESICHTQPIPQQGRKELVERKHKSHPLISL